MMEMLQRPRRLRGFGLLSAVCVSPFAFVASVAASAVQPGSLPLSDTMPAASLLHHWLDAAFHCRSVDAIRQAGDVPAMRYSAATFTSHYHTQPAQAVDLQSRLMSAANNSLYNARQSEVRTARDLHGQARLHGGRAKYASRWKTVRPTEEAYQLADEYYRYVARRDLGLPPLTARNWRVAVLRVVWA